jgi:methyltransferase (TIGR00027 family)
MVDGYNAQTEVQPMRPSQTAGLTTFFRACAYKERDERLRGPDHLARVFHVGWPRLLLATSRITLPMTRRLLPGVYEYLFARTEFFDELFERALEESCPQIVLLGAGCDSRAYRFESLVKDTTIYELDHPATQQVKRELLSRGGIAVPEYVRFVAADLNSGLLSEALASHGFHRDRRTLFLMEGVIYYLSAEGVDSLLQSVRECSSPGSGLAFDYIVESMVRGTCDRYGARQVASRVASAGETFRFGIDDHKIESFLEDRGFQLTRHLTPQDLEATYLARAGAPTRGRIAGFYSIAEAVTCRPRSALRWARQHQGGQVGDGS